MNFWIKLMQSTLFITTCMTKINHESAFEAAILLLQTEVSVLQGSQSYAVAEVLIEVSLVVVGLWHQENLLATLAGICALLSTRAWFNGRVELLTKQVTIKRFQRELEVLRRTD
jgi:hypothetical protein